VDTSCIASLSVATSGLDRRNAIVNERSPAQLTATPIADFISLLASMAADAGPATQDEVRQEDYFHTAPALDISSEPSQISW